MTKLQIEKKLVAAGFNMNTVVKIGRDNVEVLVMVEGTDRTDYDRTDRAARKAAKILGFVGGYRSGYGSWIVESKYVALPEDYCMQH